MKAPKRALVLPFVIWSLLPPGVTPVAGAPAPTAARGAAGPIQLVVDNEGSLEDHPVEDHGGERYPHLRRDSAEPDLLSPTLEPRTAKP
jgi:hypothetical protein